MVKISIGGGKRRADSNDGASIRFLAVCRGWDKVIVASYRQDEARGRSLQEMQEMVNKVLSADRTVSENPRLTVTGSSERLCARGTRTAR